MNIRNSLVVVFFIVCFSLGCSQKGLAEDVRKMEFKLRRLQMNKSLSTFHKFQPVPKGSKPLLKSEIKEI